MAGKTIRLPADRPMDAMERLYLREAVRGLKVTGAKWLKNMLAPKDPNPEVLERMGPSEVTTVEYPEERGLPDRRYRGRPSSR